MKTQLKADSMLLFITFTWGISYLLIEISLTELGAFTLNAIRFLMAFAIAAIFSFPMIRKVNLATLKASAILGFILMIVYIGATFGVQYTSLSNAGFLCALSVVFVPIFEFLMKGIRPEKKLILAVALSLAGISLLTLNSQLKPAVGDLLCILCAVAYALDLLFVESEVKKEEINAYQLGVFQLGFSGLYQLILALLVEKPHFPSDWKVWSAVLFLAIFCTGIAFIVQTIAQQYTSAAHVGVIFTLEPVFAGFAAFLFAKEILTGRGYVGAALLLCSILVMEIDWNSFMKRWEKKFPRTF
jgi:drug/metabolite transporter (DMT)-like permease